MEFHNFVSNEHLIECRYLNGYLSLHGLTLTQQELNRLLDYIKNTNWKEDIRQINFNNLKVIENATQPIH